MLRKISIGIEVTVSALEDKSGLTPDELAATVMDHVLPEREDLAAAVRVAAIKLMNGESVE